MAARLGRVIYWTCTVVAALILIVAALIATFAIHPEIESAPQGYLLMGLWAVGGVVVWLLGRAARYVLAGE